MTSNEQLLREKVWEIINTIQANSLYVHSKLLTIPINLQKEKGNLSIVNERETFVKNFRNLFSKNKDLLIDNLDKEDLGGLGNRKNTKSKKKTSKKIKFDIKLPEILTISVLNAIVPNSAMLLIGGHGGGKSSLVKHLGRMFTGISLMDTEDCIIRGHPQLTEEKMIATLNVAKLLNSGEEEVVWRTFTTSFWKILDEVNRLSPYAQNILLSMLAEGKVKYYDNVYPTDKYVLYATLNPGDIGTFEMAPPFLDRFGISVTISMPTTHDLSIILQSRDDKLVGYDELMQVPAILTKDNLLSIWFMVDKIKISKQAENFIHSIVRDFTLCDRIDKGNSEYLTPETGLCNGCHFNMDKLVCSKTISILSVRVAKDLLRYSKALAWLIGLHEVSIEVISTISPYVISHRTKFVERDLNKAPYWGNKLEYTKKLIDMVKKRFINREECYEIIDKFREGIGGKDAIDYLKSFESTDLIIKNDLIPLAKSLNNPDYKNAMKLIGKHYDKRNIKGLAEINEKLMKDLTFPNRGELINKINTHMKELTYWARDFSFRRWDVIRHTISSIYANFSKQLDESTKKQCTLQLRDKNIFLEINVTGMEPGSMVQINCHGGKEAKDLQDILNKIYPKDDYDLKSEEELNTKANEDSKDEIIESDYNIDDGSKKGVDERTEDDKLDALLDDVLKED